jgi:branched-chain amino acid transport system ATP-binding protein
LDALKVANLHAYYGKAHIIQGVDLAIGRGQIVGIFGRNGAGKTTLLRSIMNLVPRVEGEITLFGRSLSSLGTDERARAGIAWMTQDMRVFPELSVAENCRVAASAVPSPTPIEDVLTVIPELRDHLHRPAGRLSGGQQQLVALARSLTLNCQVLMLDEPTEGLMPRLVTRIGEIIQSLAARSVSVLVVEQNVALGLAVCKDIYILEKGSIVARGSPETMVADRLLERFLSIRSRSERITA